MLNVWKGKFMKILAVGDIVGWPGVKAVSRLVPEYKRQNRIDFVIANGENANGLGISPQQAQEILSSGVDVITLGNHTWAKKEIIPFMEKNTKIIRPYNYLSRYPGRGYGIYSCCGKKICVINLLGTIGMDYIPENPFYAVDKLLAELAGKADIFAVDFHAETTSEKYAMFHYLAGRISVLFGTHTHVQTADATVYKGTGYITDLGMTGPCESVLGIKAYQSIANFKGEMREKFETADGPSSLCGAIFELNDDGSCCGCANVRVDLD